jgi:hypothetical protein
MPSTNPALAAQKQAAGEPFFPDHEPIVGACGEGPNGRMQWSAGCEYCNWRGTFTTDNALATKEAREHAKLRKPDSGKAIINMLRP